MKKVAVGGMLVGLAFIIAGAFWLAYRNSVENGIVANQTPVQSPVVTDQEAPTAKQGAQDSPTEAAEGEAETAANGDAPPLITKPRVAYTNEKGELIGITRQGNEYIINPMWYGPANPKVHSDSWAAAAAEPTGPPLSHNWREAKGASGAALEGADFSDPRTWESYRNFWGFDRPMHTTEKGWQYRAILDNWGTPIQWHNDTMVVHHYSRRRGFRPNPEQLERYLSLEAERNRARLDGSSALAAILQKEMRLLEKSAQGMLPDTLTCQMIFYGDHYPGGRPPEMMKELERSATQRLYKRMGIEHLYDFYENPDFRKNRK